jgi:hypothetical protein
MASGHVNRAEREAEHMAAPTTAALVKKVLANPEPSAHAQAVWKGVGMSTIVSGTLASAIVEYRSEQNRLPDRSRRSLGRLLALI